MTNEEKSRINNFVRLWSYEDAKGLLICAIIIVSIIIPLATFSFAIQTGERVVDTVWIYIMMLGGIVLIASFITLSKIKKHPIIMHLFFSFSSFVFSLTFFAVFYSEMYKIVKVSTFMYLYGAIIGYVTLFISLFYYRYRVYKGFSKNISGSPRYGVIASFTIFGGIIFRAIMSRMGENIQQMVLAFLALFVSYALSFGIVSILNFAIGIKYRKEIEFSIIRK